MTLLDWLVISGISAVAAYSLAAPYLSAVAGFFRPAKGSDDIESWRQKWVSGLVTLGREIEAGKGNLPRAPEAQRLARELLWELIGGDVETGGKK